MISQMSTKDVIVLIIIFIVINVVVQIVTPKVVKALGI